MCLRSRFYSLRLHSLWVYSLSLQDYSVPYNCLNCGECHPSEMTELNVSSCEVCVFHLPPFIYSSQCKITLQAFSLWLCKHTSLPWATCFKQLCLIFFESDSGTFFFWKKACFFSKINWLFFKVTIGHFVGLKCAQKHILSCRCSL